LSGHQFPQLRLDVREPAPQRRASAFLGFWVRQAPIRHTANPNPVWRALSVHHRIASRQARIWAHRLFTVAVNKWFGKYAKNSSISGRACSHSVKSPATALLSSVTAMLSLDCGVFAYLHTRRSACPISALCVFGAPTGDARRNFPALSNCNVAKRLALSFAPCRGKTAGRRPDNPHPPDE
jgi:hypothetical protein